MNCVYVRFMSAFLDIKISIRFSSRSSAVCLFNFYRVSLGEGDHYHKFSPLLVKREFVLYGYIMASFEGRME